jgi:hypothetical protein
VFDRLTTFPCCRRLVSLLGALVLAAPGVTASPDWFARTWQSDAGLPDNTVVGIDQTPTDLSGWPPKRAWSVLMACGFVFTETAGGKYEGRKT